MIGTVSLRQVCGRLGCRGPVRSPNHSSSSETMLLPGPDLRLRTDSGLATLGCSEQFEAGSGDPSASDTDTDTETDADTDTDTDTDTSVDPNLWMFGALLRSNPNHALQEVDLATVEPDWTHPAEVSPSEVQTLLGSPARVLPPGSEWSAMSYTLGEGLGLEAGTDYMLELVYPEDVSRSMFVINRGAETMRGFHTGAALGDALGGYTTRTRISTFP